jgi:hypothetical protein
MSDLQFRSKEHDGFGENWPIRYQDLAPYYDKVEPLWRVAGRRDGLPQIPDGIFLEDTSRDSESVQRFARAAKAQGIPTIKPRRATGTLASSMNRLLPAALETGYLTVVPNAVVSKITTNADTGLADGALFIDRRSHREMQVKARVVVVGASCLESTRLPLNSGLANSSGVLGRYLFDQFYMKDSVEAIVPEARGRHPPISKPARKRAIVHQGLCGRFQQRRRAIEPLLARLWTGSAETTFRTEKCAVHDDRDGHGAAPARELCANRQNGSRCMGHPRAQHTGTIHG